MDATSGHCGRQRARVVGVVELHRAVQRPSVRSPGSAAREALRSPRKRAPWRCRPRARPSWSPGGSVGAEQCHVGPRVGRGRGEEQPAGRSRAFLGAGPKARREHRPGKGRVAAEKVTSGVPVTDGRTLRTPATIGMSEVRIRPDRAVSHPATAAAPGSPAPRARRGWRARPGVNRPSTPDDLDPDQRVLVPGRQDAPASRLPVGPPGTPGSPRAGVRARMSSGTTSEPASQQAGCSAASVTVMAARPARMITCRPAGRTRGASTSRRSVTCPWPRDVDAAPRWRRGHCRVGRTPRRPRPPASRPGCRARSWSGARPLLTAEEPGAPGGVGAGLTDQASAGTRRDVAHLGRRRPPAPAIHRLVGPPARPRGAEADQTPCGS